MDSWMESCPGGSFRTKDRLGNPITLERIRSLHSSLSPSPFLFGLVWTHSKIVASIAYGMALSFKRHGSGSLDPDLAVVGALLHDVGAYKASPDGISFGSSYLFHGLYGYDALLRGGFGEEVAEFAKNHTGSGISAEEVAEEGLALPAGDYLPRTPEQKIVAYSDCLHTKSNPPAFVSLRTAERKLARFGRGPLERLKGFEREFGRPDLTELAKSLGMRIL